MWVVLLYLSAIVCSNIWFTTLPIIQTPYGVIPTMAFFVGLIFIIRDYVQQRIGHHVLWVMVCGGIISGLLADPNIAIASVLSFLISEFVDYLVFTYTRRPLYDRILLSSVISVPVDSALFLYMIGFGSPISILIMSLSKIFVAGGIWVYFKFKGNKQ